MPRQIHLGLRIEPDGHTQVIQWLDGEGYDYVKSQIIPPGSDGYILGRHLGVINGLFWHDEDMGYEPGIVDNYTASALHLKLRGHAIPDFIIVFGTVVLTGETIDGQPQGLTHGQIVTIQQHINNIPTV